MSTSSQSQASPAEGSREPTTPGVKPREAQDSGADESDSPVRPRSTHRARRVARTTSDNDAGNTIELLDPWDFSI